MEAPGTRGYWWTEWSSRAAYDACNRARDLPARPPPPHRAPPGRSPTPILLARAGRPQPRPWTIAHNEGRHGPYIKTGGAGHTREEVDGHPFEGRHQVLDHADRAWSGPTASTKSSPRSQQPRIHEKARADRKTRGNRGAVLQDVCAGPELKTRWERHAVLALLEARSSSWGQLQGLESSLASRRKGPHLDFGQGSRNESRLARAPRSLMEGAVRPSSVAGPKLDARGCWNQDWPPIGTPRCRNVSRSKPSTTNQPPLPVRLKANVA